MALGLVGFFGGVILNNGGCKVTLLPLAAIVLMPFSINLFCKVYAVIFVMMLFISWSTILQKFLSMRILTWLGDRSLSIYLVHFPVQIGIMLALGSKVPFTSYWLLFSYGLILIGVAHLTHNLIEMPAQAWINSLGKKSPHDSQLRATPR